VGLVVDAPPTSSTNVVELLHEPTAFRGTLGAESLALHGEAS
jgi:hypothetical protein